MESDRLYDCLITYHLMNGETINESYRKDIPDKLWSEIMLDYAKFSEVLELTPTDTYAKVLLPKSNVSYITLKVLTCTH